MIFAYYNILFILSVILLMVLAVRWRIRIDIDFAVFFIIVPIDLLGYMNVAMAKNVETAILGNNLIYLGGCFLQLLSFMIVCNLCHITLKTWMRLILFGTSIIMYLCSMTVGHATFFYKSLSIEQRNGITVMVKEYGPVHSLFYVMILIYVIATFAVLLYSYFNKKEASIRHIMLMFGMMFMTVIFFFGGRLITKDVELAPVGYIITEIVFLFISHRTRLYYITGDISANVLEEGADGLVCFDMQRKLLVSNKTAQNMIPGLRSAQTDHLLNETVDEFRQLGECVIRFASGEKGDSPDIVLDGRTYQTRVEFITDGKKNVGYYVVLRDVSAERKYLEGVSKYNEQMRAAANAAIAADNAKTHFLAQMSHEIRTPINAILGMNEMIMRECQDKSILDYASSIETSGHTLLYLINSILDFSKIEDGKMEVINADYDTVKFITGLVSTTQPRADEKGLKFELYIDDTLPSVMNGDDMRLSQVVSNLLSNAVKYTDEGEISLSIRRNRGMGKEGDQSIWVHVEVSDTGIGIRNKDMDRLFHSFERLDESRNRNIEGTGLGMSIVYHLLDLMGSRINVKSEYGKGSTFWFDIRQEVSDPTPIGNYKERIKTEDMRRKKNITLYAPEARILVVDDNALNQKVTRNYLKLCGIVPDEAMSGSSAIEYMKNNTYDVVFLDHMMPEMDGIETLEIIRREKLAPESTVMVVLTANAIEGSREMYLKAGFDDYISKPVDLTEMVNKLEGYLKNGRGTDT